ncbi:MAG: chemotaxis protein CheA [Dehalobacterium sp.]
MFSQEEIDVFFDELEEKLEVISNGLLVLEKNGYEADTVDEIFRAAHTIKGSSGIMGFEKMSKLTHEMENLLDQLRHEKIGVDNHLVTLLFECLDCLKVLQNEIYDGEEKSEIKTLVQKLGEFILGHESIEDSSNPETDLITISDNFWLLSSDEIKLMNEGKGLKPYGIKGVFDPSCLMKTVRALILLENLADVGKVIRSNPEREQLQDEIEGNEINVILLSDRDFDTIEKLINTVPEIVSFDMKILSWDREEGGNADFSAADEDESEKSNGRSDSNGKERATSHTVRVDIRKLDILMNLIGELVIDRTRLTQLNNDFESHYGSNNEVISLRQISTHLARVTNDLQEEIMKTRMLPIAQVFNRFPRLVRDLAQRFGKDIQLIIEGKETELDRTLIEGITDPLIHMIRNAVGHGLEMPEERKKAGKPLTGKISLRARQQENHIVIEVEDDGRGIDEGKLKKNALEKGLVTQERLDNMSSREALNLIFMPGFSTAQEIDDVSGRGVGMDVVRRMIEQVNGLVEINTQLGRGTKFTLKLPLTLAIIQALLVGNLDEVYAFPLTNVLETLRVHPKDVQTIKNCEVIMLRGHVLPLVRLRQLFGDERNQEESFLYVVVVSIDGEKIGIIVDSLIGEQEIVIKGLGDYLGRVPGFAGATILGDGKVALIIDVRSLTNDIN